MLALLPHSWTGVTRGAYPVELAVVDDILPTASRLDLANGNHAKLFSYPQQQGTI
jgi:uncharacterized protein YqjF (DUF2071 family)